MSKPIYKQSWDYCHETCPDVDVAFRDAWDALEKLVAPSLTLDAKLILNALSKNVKELGTEKLRDALCSAIKDKNEAEGERDALEERVRSLESTIDELRREMDTMQEAA